MREVAALQSPRVMYTSGHPRGGESATHAPCRPLASRKRTRSTVATSSGSGRTRASIFTSQCLERFFLPRRVTLVVRLDHPDALPQFAREDVLGDHRMDTLPPPIVVRRRPVGRPPDLTARGCGRLAPCPARSGKAGVRSIGN